MANKFASEVRITDPYTISLVAEEAALRGDRTLTRTAGRLIQERVSQLEISRRTTVLVPRRRRSTTKA